MLRTEISISTSVKLIGLYWYSGPAGGAATSCHYKDNSNKMFFFSFVLSAYPNMVFLALGDKQIGKVVIFKFSIHDSFFPRTKTRLSWSSRVVGCGPALTRPWMRAMTQRHQNPDGNIMGLSKWMIYWQPGRDDKLMNFVSGSVISRAPQWHKITGGKWQGRQL